METINNDVDYAMGWAWAGMALREGKLTLADVETLAPRRTAAFLAGARHKITAAQLAARGAIGVAR